MNRIETKIIVMVTNRLAAAKDSAAKDDLIEELSENLYQRYLDLTAQNVPEQEALQQAMDSLGDVQELLDYLAYLEEDDLQTGGGAERQTQDWQGTSSKGSSAGSSDGQSFFGDGFSADKWEDSIEAMVSKALSMAKTAVDYAGDVTKDVAKDVSKYLKEKRPEGSWEVDLELGGRRWKKSVTFGKDQDVVVCDGSEDGECVIEAESVQSLDVELAGGDVQVYTEDTDQIRLIGDLDGIQYAVNEEGVLTIRQNATASSAVLFGRGARWTDLEIYLPEKQWNRISLQSKSGDIDVDEGCLLCDTFYANSKSGDIRVSSVESSKTALRSMSGDVSCENMTGRLYINSTSGDVRVESCCLEHLGATTASGDIYIESELKEVNATSASGDVEIVSVGETPSNLKVATASGDCLVEFTAGGGFSLHYNTASGTVSYELDDLPVELNRDRSGKRGNIKYMDGAASSMVVSTGSGDIELRIQ